MPEKSDSADSYGSWKFPYQSSECKWGRGEGQQHDVSVAVIQMQPSAHTIYQVLSWAALWRPPVMGFRETGGRTPDELLVTSAHTFNLKRTIFLKGLNEEWNHKFYSIKNFFFSFLISNWYEKLKFAAILATHNFLQKYEATLQFDRESIGRKWMHWQRGEKKPGKPGTSSVFDFILLANTRSPDFHTKVKRVSQLFLHLVLS